MSGPPSRGRRVLDDEQLVALAKSLPPPDFADARREEMRTAFLSTVRGLRSGARTRTSAGRARRRRLLLIGALLCAGAGAAAAAWRIGSASVSRPAPTDKPAQRPTVAAERPAAPLQAPAAQGNAPAAQADAPAAQADAPTPEEAQPQRHVSGPRPRKLALVDRREIGGRSGDGGGSAFARGWSALGSGDFSTAAAAFGRAAAGKDNPLTEDALFWRGAALDRAGRFVAAGQALSDFLARYPDSERKGEASVILGWLLVRAGEPGEARERFVRALDDPAERVRGSARAGLDAVAASPR